MIDEFTRVSAGAIITSKAAAPKVFMKHWLTIFGVSRKFIGDSFINICKRFNIKIQTSLSKLCKQNKH